MVKNEKETNIKDQEPIKEIVKDTAPKIEKVDNPIDFKSKYEESQKELVEMRENNKIDNFIKETNSSLSREEVKKYFNVKELNKESYNTFKSKITPQNTTTQPLPVSNSVNNNNIKNTATPQVFDFSKVGGPILK